MKSLTSSFVIALIAVVLIPPASFGQIPYGLGLSCNNGMLMGSYTAQMGIDVLNMLNNVNGTSGTSAADAGFGSSTGVASSLTLSGDLLGLSRFYFDGQGNIVGTANAGPISGISQGGANTSMTNSFLVPAGSYTVNPDCTGIISLGTGSSTAKFNAVVAAAGAQILVQETDSSNPGVVGTLIHGPNFCGSDYNNPQSFAFAYDGIMPGGTATSSANATPARLYSNLGILTLDGAGNFTITYWENQGGTIQRNGTNSMPLYGTYSITSATCAVSLNYTSAKGPAFNMIAAAGGLNVFTVSPSALTPMVGTFVNVGRGVNSTYGVNNQ
ncbi:MAG TPA: hypothetical protein VKB88_29150 [Bryobacteraceae bacterium]|nr:hypothetical protein [Bryobacteraceae bacterium]